MVDVSCNDPALVVLSMSLDFWRFLEVWDKTSSALLLKQLGYKH